MSPSKSFETGLREDFKKKCIFDHFFIILSFFDIKFTFCDQNTYFIDKSNHFSFQNGLAFDLVMSSYQLKTQNVKVVVQKTSKNALIREK